MSNIVDKLREDHRNIARLLNALDHQIDVFADAGRPDYDVVRGIAEYFLDYPDSCHHPAEDAVFERLRDRYPEAAATLDDLEAEHREIRAHARRFRDDVAALLGDSDIARDEVVAAARDFVAAQRRHLTMEEERFFPAAEAAFGPADWSHVADRLADRRDPLFDGDAERKFADLRERLLEWEREYGEG